MISPYIQFDNFTENARQALTLAYQEAAKQKHGYVGIEQLLLGIASESEGVAGRVLTQLELSPDNIKQQVKLSQHGVFVPEGATGVSPVLYRVFEAAVDQANKTGQAYVNTGHLLLRLIDNGDDVAKDVLKAANGGVENVQIHTQQLLQQVSPTASTE